MVKKIVSGDEARLKLLKGVETVANAVKITLGPKGRNAVVDGLYLNPVVTNDGVTIAKLIELDDEVENTGAMVLKEACIKTNDIAGDGTTTATILTERIFSEGLKSCNLGANPIMLRAGIKDAINFVVGTIAKQSKPVKDNISIEQVAKISSGSADVGKLIAKAFDEVGLDGVITIEEGKNSVNSLNIVEGTRINKGYISPYMCSDQEKMIAELINPYILITDKKISHISEILPVVEKVASVGGCLFILAEDVEGDALSTLVVNNMRKTFNCLCVKTPYFGDRRKKVLDDLALIVGAKFISGDIYNNFNEVTLEDLGRCDKIKADKDNTTIIGASGDKVLMQTRADELKERLKEASTEFDRIVLQG